MIDWLSVAILVVPWTLATEALWLRLILLVVVFFALIMADRRHKELLRRVRNLERAEELNKNRQARPYVPVPMYGSRNKYIYEGEWESTKNE